MLQPLPYGKNLQEWAHNFVAGHVTRQKLRFQGDWMTKGQAALLLKLCLQQTCQCTVSQVRQVCNKHQTCSKHASRAQRDTGTVAWTSAVEPSNGSLNQNLFCLDMFHRRCLRRQSYSRCSSCQSIGIDSLRLWSWVTVWFAGAVLQQIKTPLHEVELLPILLSVIIRGSQLWQCQVMCYLDNEAAKSWFDQRFGSNLLNRCYSGKLLRLWVKAGA